MAILNAVSTHVAFCEDTLVAELSSRQVSSCHLHAPGSCNAGFFKISSRARELETSKTATTRRVAWCRVSNPLTHPEHIHIGKNSRVELRHMLGAVGCRR